MEEAERIGADLWERARPLLLEEGGSMLFALVGAIAILVLGLVLSGWAARGAQRLLSRVKMIDPTLARFLASLARYAVLAVAVLAALERFGIETTSLAALIGAAGLSIGLALQGTLTHVAAGVMLAIFRPFRIGDSITVGGNTGTVTDINIFFTVLETADGLRVFQPNGQIWGQPLVNNTALARRRAEIVLPLEDPADLARAKAIAEEVVAAMVAAGDGVLAEPAPQILSEPAPDGSIPLTVRVWVERPRLLDLRTRLAEELLARIAAAGIPLGPPNRMAAAKGRTPRG